MLLVATDFMRTIWGMTYPIVAFAIGQIDAPNIYCQASGFLAVYFIECSDFLILAIAIHTAVYVFHPTISTPGHREEGGIWKWRYWVYLSILCLSGLFTGLAFVNKSGPAFVPLVTW